MLPKLVERAGRSGQGTITGFYSVLVEADDPNEPIADYLRGLLDGHVWLSRKLAARGHYPAIDVLQSLSRLMPDVTPPPQMEAATAVRRLLAAYSEHEDLITLGAYRQGTNPTLDLAISARAGIHQFLQQPLREASSLEAAQQALMELTHSFVSK
jgi:flagellum-specific ATP synthase